MMGSLALAADSRIFTEDPVELYELISLRLGQISNVRPISPRGRSRMHRPTRRVRGARCRESRHQCRGHGMLAQEQATRQDTEELEDEFDLGDDGPIPPFQAVGERKNYTRWRKSVRRARRRERRVDSAVVLIEARFQQLALKRPEIEARCRFLRDYLEFFKNFGSGDKRSQEVLLNHQIELFDLETELLLIPAA